MTVRAKFVVDSMVYMRTGIVRVNLRELSSLMVDGEYSPYPPHGHMELYMDSKTAEGRLKINDEFRVDFTPVEQE